MTDTAVKPVITGITTQEQAYATRYKQGGRTVYALTLSPAELISMIAQPDPKIPNPGNRAIRENHARAFADYYLKHENWVIPAIILRAPNIFSFEPDNDRGWGVLSYPKTSAMDIQILDGQHRILGFHIAARVIQQQAEKARDFRARALRSEGGNKNAPVVREAQAQIQAAEDLAHRFTTERVNVEIHVTDDTMAYRQMFFDIADNALGITASVKTRFDSNKVANRALPLVLEHPLLLGRVDLESDRVKTNSNDLMTAKHVGDIIRAAQVGIDGRIGTIMERTLNDRKVSQDAIDYLDSLLVAFPQLEALKVGQISAQTLRETSLLGSPAILRILAGVRQNLMSDKHGWTAEQVTDYFRALNPHMAGGAHRNSIWLRIESTSKEGFTQKAFAEGAFAPGGRRQDLAAVEDTLVDWAILGKQGAPWVWEKPADPPAPEPTEDEKQLAADIAADPELEKLLAEQKAFEEKSAKNAKKKRSA